FGKSADPPHCLSGSATIPGTHPNLNSSLDNDQLFKERSFVSLSFLFPIKE
ncbi:hypothetical protein NDU88_000013, partial [Pleurodeles waltl]